LTLSQWGGPTEAKAQVSEPTGFDLQHYRTPLDHEGLLDLGWGRLPKAGSYEGLFNLHYMNDPMVIYRVDPLNPKNRPRIGSLVSDRVDLDLGGSVSVLSYLEIGIATRIVLFQTRKLDPEGVFPGLKKLPVVGVGDLRIEPKLAILRQEQAGVDLAFLLAATLPLSGGKAYLGERSATLSPELDVSRNFEGFRLGANLAYTMRGHSELLGLSIDDEFRYRLGGAYDLKALTDQELELQLAISGATAAASPFKESGTSPLELLMGGRYRIPKKPLELSGGFGVGLTHGYGSPDFRIFIGLRYLQEWKAPNPDQDGDGVMDLVDDCPVVKGPLENRGCPDKDGDGDGLVDRLDPCPEQAGELGGDGCPSKDRDKDGLVNESDECPEQAGPIENRGCPDQDRDKDGFVDRLDRCPDQPGPASLAEGVADGCPVIDHDRDKDGLLDEIDACPDQPGPVEGKGCPDQDGDADGVVDRLDRCPEEAGSPENEGCPERDSDGDGLNDRVDSCVDQAEDQDGFQDEDGCPDPDNDNDGLMDAHDRCPMEAGPTENHGCPDLDRDSDGVVDREDNCPDEPGEASNQGCKLKQLVVLRGTKLEILETVFFRSGKAVIESRSFPLLNNVVEVLKAHPEILKLNIEGHTDSQGNDLANKKLSQRRAEAVRVYLIGQGLEEARLSAQGYGEERPIESNQSAKGRAANRRVEFMIPEEAPALELVPATPQEQEKEKQ